MSLFTSITSTNLQKIVLPLRFGFRTKEFSGFARYRQSLDDCLCRLVEQLRRSGYKQRPELVLLTRDVPDDEKGFEEFLPKFREQGRVKFIRELDGRVVYSSDQ